MSRPPVPGTSKPIAPGASLGRVDAIDLYRGLIIVLMLLDHTRDFVHREAFSSDPLDPARTTPLLYFTRWITHLCAPAFVFLAGAGAGFQLQRGTSVPALARFLLTRGLWLIVVELLAVRLLMWWDMSPTLLVQLEVIWVIGASMIVLAALLRLPLWAVLSMGTLIVAGHNLLDAVRVPPWGPGAPLPTLPAKLWMILYQGGFFPLWDFPGPLGWSVYPLLPWIGIMALGFCCAQLWTWPPERRRLLLGGLGIAAIAVFFIIRALNGYGDPRPWQGYDTPIQTAMSFLNTRKYPPSLLFVLMTLGPGLLLLAWAGARPLTARLARACITFGRVPLFFFLIQWIWVKIAGITVTAAAGLPVGFYFKNPVQLFLLGDGPAPLPGGSLAAVYACWLLGAVVLYFPCRWYASLRKRRPDLVLLRYL